MTLDTFYTSLGQDAPPKEWEPALLALWYDAKGDWESSHSIVQELNTVGAAGIHAYLHRKEGDNWNADYWYRRAGTTRPNISIDAEFLELLKKHASG